MSVKTVAPTFIPVDTRAIPRDALRATYDHRSKWQKCADLVMSIFRQVQYLATYLYYRFFASSQFGNREIEWQPNSQGLVVMIHGLNGHPANWFSQISQLQKHRHIDVFTPFVRDRGLCSLEDAGNPILAEIQHYAQNNPGKPICLLGLSNGSRIATWLETELRQRAPESPVHVSTVAGVHRGSSRINLLETLHLPRFFQADVIIDELGYQSRKSQELLSKVRTHIQNGCAPRSYEFYASTEDFCVPDLDSSLPYVGKNESCYLTHAQSHDSLVQAVADRQIRNCLTWINRFQQTV